LLFKKPLLEKVLSGEKTQTRRLSTRTYTPGRIYGVTCRRYQKSQAHIQITNATQQRLGDINEIDAIKEGLETKEQFLKTWQEINGVLDLNSIVIVYDFKVVKKE
jgi:hypothetical protein